MNEMTDPVEQHALAAEIAGLPNADLQRKWEQVKALQDPEKARILVPLFSAELSKRGLPAN